LIRAARDLAPEGMSVELIEIGGLPFYNADLEAEGDPATVAAFKSSVEQADGVLIATPEYNDGIPAVLTNAIDWGSRLPVRAPLTGLPVAIMGASPSQVGTARGQMHLRQILGHIRARVLPPPEVLVARAHERFDKDLRLTDHGTQRVLVDLLQRFSRWIEREQAADRAVSGMDSR